MKNILVVLVLFAVSQLLVAIAQDVNPALNGPTDCGDLRKPVIERIFSSSKPMGGNKCSGILEEFGKQKVIEPKEKAPFEESDEPGICCGPEEENVERNKRRIKIK